jgi:hypothetical protein
VLCKWPDESIGKIFRLRGPYGESAAPSPLLGELNWNSLKIKKNNKKKCIWGYGGATAGGKGIVGNRCCEGGGREVDFFFFFFLLGRQP